MVINMFLCFVITLLSGLTTLLGSLIIFINIKDKNKIISYSMFFSSGVMLYISIFDLIPASFSYINKIYDFIPSMAIMGAYGLFGGGIITFVSSSKNISLGLSLSLSIALHNIPEGIAIAIPIYYGENSKKKAFYYTLIAALSEPLGALIGIMFINNINDYLFAILLSLTSGIMIYLSIFELYKEGKIYRKKEILY